MYEIRDIDENPEHREAYSKLGTRGVPTLDIDGQVLVGFEPQRIEGLLDYRVTRCPSCGARMRVPKGKGKIRITCQSCGHVFEQTT